MPQYFFSRDGTTQEGPIEAEAFIAMFRSGQLSPDSKVWREGLADWVQAYTLPEVQHLTMDTAEAAVGVARAIAATDAPPLPAAAYSPPMVPGPLGNPTLGRADGLAVTSLVLGCVSLVGMLCAGGFILPLAIVGLVLGIVSKSRVGTRTAGIVTNSIALALSAAFGVIMIIALAAGTP